MMSKMQTKLNVIYGRSGTGKSEYLYRDMEQKISQFKNIFVIVPEQSNLVSEKKFFEITGRKAMLNVEVLTLSRMAYRVLEELEIATNSLTKVGKSMLIFELLSQNKKALKFLGKSEKNIQIIDKMLTEFKKHNVSVEDLKNLKLEDQYVSLKLQDMTLLYEKYEEKLAQNLVDENDELTILKSNLKFSKMFENSCIYMDEFFGFTPQEYGIFEELLKLCREMNVAVCLDCLESTKKKENDIFYFNRKYAKKLLEIASKQGCKIEFIKRDKPYRFKNNELVILEKNLYGNTQKWEEKIENMELFLANNPYSEMDYVAKKIYHLVKNDGYKYYEIAIIANDIENYAEDSKAIFQKYQIPIFIDEKKDLNQNILIRYLISLLDIFDYNWSFDAVFNYLKIGLLGFDFENICRLENYCKKWGIRGIKWQREFLYEPLNENQENLEKMRRKIVEPLLILKNNFFQNKTVADLTQIIYDFLLENDIIHNLNEKVIQANDVEISNEYNTSYKILMHVLEELVKLFGKEKITFEKYKELLKVGIQASELR